MVKLTHTINRIRIKHNPFTTPKDVNKVEFAKINRKNMLALVDGD